MNWHLHSNNHGIKEYRTDSFSGISIEEENGVYFFSCVSWNGGSEEISYFPITREECWDLVNN
uniref:Uncharacterized protein n=1 Tax=viral metagenome TaxID=1070528 RepID=A0A6H2A344_9ZZZZ